jgi:geranylgeranyl reductase family protein
MYDVIVVGGGPVGSHTAAELADRGNRVAVLEQKEKLGQPVCCTGIISQQCVNEFSIDEGLILRRLNSASIFSPGGKAIKLRRPQTQACVVDRATFDAAIAEHAQSAGVEYLLGYAVKDIVIEKDKVLVKAVRQTEKQEVATRAVVVASGFSPRLVERLGLGKIKDFALGVQAEVEAKNVEEVEVYTGGRIAPGFFAWLVPTEDGMARVGLISRRQPKQYLHRLIAALTARGKIGKTEVELPSRRMPLGLLPKTYGWRLMVVGDAAGQVKPTTGGGIYYGLLCAGIAAGVLSAALEEDDLSAARLAVYQRQCRKLLGQDIRLGGLARRFYQLLSDGQLDSLFGLANASGVVEAMLGEENLTFDWHGRVVVSLIKKRFLAGATATLKIPFRFGADQKEDNGGR